MTVLLTIWLCWCCLCLSVVLLNASLGAHTEPCFDGFRARIPSWTVRALTLRELDAVLEHELGHGRLGHVWINLALLCVFVPITAARRERQEFQADDCVADPAALASALLKISDHPLDVRRAMRLALRAAAEAKGRQEAGDLTARDARTTQEGAGE